jgi:hypothetical protein
MFTNTVKRNQGAGILKRKWYDYDLLIDGSIVDGSSLDNHQYGRLQWKTTMDVVRMMLIDPDVEGEIDPLGNTDAIWQWQSAYIR